MKKTFLPIGTGVVVYKKVDNPTDYRTGLKSLKVTNLDLPVDGQIVGGTYMALGKYNAGSYHPSSYGPAYVSVDSMIFVYLVRLGFTNKPIKVRFEDLQIDNIYPHSLPFRYAKKYEWTEKDKQFMRDMMKGAPRDSKGRWIK
jgi:hypothetical protein